VTDRDELLGRRQVRTLVEVLFHGHCLREEDIDPFLDNLFRVVAPLPATTGEGERVQKRS
jgi:hypothetical protein